MRTMSLKLPDSLHVRVRALADKQKVSKSAIVREALAEYFSNGRCGRRLSVHDLVKEFAGCVEGPGDLSYNEKYMEGFGK